MGKLHINGELLVDNISKFGGSISPTEASKYSCGISAAPWKQVISKLYGLVDNGIIYSQLAISSTEPERVNLMIGNSIPSGTAGSGYGVLQLHSSSTGGAALFATVGTDTVTSHELPAVSGILLNSGNYNNYAPTLTGGGASGTWGISIIGNALTATTLQTSRTINGTSFNGSKNITTSNWGTARNFTIGYTTKSINGSTAISWSLDEITNCDNIWINGIMLGPNGIPNDGTHHGGYIDFHYDSNTEGAWNSTRTSRIIEHKINNNLGIDFHTSNLYLNAVNFTEVFGNGTKTKVLWTKPTSVIGAGLIELDLTGYDYIMVTSTINEADLSYAGNALFSGMCKNVAGCSGYTCTFGSDFWLHTRRFYVRANGIEFESGAMRAPDGTTYTNWDSRSIPYQIIGIKLGR